MSWLYIITTIFNETWSENYSFFAKISYLCVNNPLCRMEILHADLTGDSFIEKRTRLLS